MWLLLVAVLSLRLDQDLYNRKINSVVGIMSATEPKKESYVVLVLRFGVAINGVRYRTGG